MPIFIEILHGADSLCGPDARFMLEVIATGSLQAFAPMSEVSVKTLAKCLHLEECVVSDALNELVAVGLMKRFVEQRVGRGGRAAVSYKLCSEACRLPDMEMLSRLHHSDFLRALFSGEDMAFPVIWHEQTAVKVVKEKEGKWQPPGGRGRLSIRNRLLFAALLSRADLFGETQISISELGGLTGMRPEQVKNRLHRLMAVGLIRSHVPGLSSSIFAKGRVSSTYFLNVDALAAEGGVAVHMAYYGEAKLFTHADNLWAEIKGRGDLLSYSSEAARVAVHHFFANQRRAVVMLFQHLLYRYASRLLSRYWHKLASQDPIDDAELRKWIRADFRWPGSEVAQELDGGACSDFELVCDHFYRQATEVAREYRTRFGQADWVGFDLARIRILPAADGLGYKVLTIMLRPAPPELGRCSVLLESRPGEVELRSVNAESDLSLKDRVGFGLLALPPGKARAAASQ